MLPILNVIRLIQPWKINLVIITFFPGINLWKLLRPRVRIRRMPPIKERSFRVFPDTSPHVLERDLIIFFSLHTGWRDISPLQELIIIFLSVVKLLSVSLDTDADPGESLEGAWLVLLIWEVLRRILVGILDVFFSLAYLIRLKNVLRTNERRLDWFALERISELHVVHLWNRGSHHGLRGTWLLLELKSLVGKEVRVWVTAFRG